MSAEQIVQDGDHVRARFRFTGTREGTVMGVPATCRRVDVGGYEVRLIAR
jgi:predicted ester cyclase